ncbi:hypothetical protein D9M71_335090 [compost metagenome]
MQQAGGHFRLVRQKCVFDALAQLATADEPLAGAAIQRLLPTLGDTTGDHSGDRRVHAVQPGAAIQRFLDERPALLQMAQHLRALADAEQVLAERRIEALQAGQRAQRLGPRRRQIAEHLALQVTLDQMVAVHRGRQLTALATMQAQTHPGVPAAGLLQQAIDQLCRAPVTVADEQFAELGGSQRQFGATDFEQLALQQQTFELAMRPAAAGDPPEHIRRRGLQQSVEEAVCAFIGKTWEIIEHQPDRAALLHQVRLDRRQVGTFQAEGGSQQLEKPGLIELQAFQVEPVQAGFGWAGLGAFAQKKALAAAGRRADQAQPAFGVEQGFTEAGSREEPGRQGWSAGEVVFVSRQRHGATR